MTASINGYVVTGTPQEIAQLIRELKPGKLSYGNGTLVPEYPPQQYWVGDPVIPNNTVTC